MRNYCSLEIIKNNDERMSSVGPFHCLLKPSGKTYIPCFSKIALLRNDWYRKRKEGVPDKALLSSVSTDVFGTPSISTGLFHPVKHPELLPTFTRTRVRATHHLPHYAGTDIGTNLRFMGPACGPLFRMTPHSHWDKNKSPYTEFQSHETEENRTLTLRRLMSYIYIYIWSTHSWCF